MKRYIIIAFIFLLSACRTQKVYIPVENTKVEYRDRTQRDSIYLHDSIYVSKMNDTIYFEKYRTLYIDRVLKDSIFINDTIRVPYEVVKTKIENKLNLWQRIIQIVGYFSIGIFAGWGIWKWRKTII